MTGFWIGVGLFLFGYQLDHGLVMVAKAIALSRKGTDDGE
jgi:hypothetical protein